MSDWLRNEKLNDLGTVHELNGKFYKKVPESCTGSDGCAGCAFRDEDNDGEVCCGLPDICNGYDFNGCGAGFKWVEVKE